MGSKTFPEVIPSPHLMGSSFFMVVEQVYIHLAYNEGKHPYESIQLAANPHKSVKTK